MFFFVKNSIKVKTITCLLLYDFFYCERIGPKKRGRLESNKVIIYIGFTFQVLPISLERGNAVLKKYMSVSVLSVSVLFFSVILLVPSLTVAEKPPVKEVKSETIVSEPAPLESAGNARKGIEPLRKLSALEVFRNKKLLEKTIKDLDAYRIMLKYLVSEHHDDSQRLLLLEETDNFIDKNVDPLIADSLNYNDETFKLVITLRFYKAFVYFEAEKYDRYQEILTDMKRVHGNEFLGIAISPFGEKYKSIGDAVKNLRGMIL